MKDYIDQSIHEKADVDCTLMELWERYQEEIAVFRNFANAKETIKSYTTTLSVIKEALEEKTAAAMMPIDCWNAVVSVRYRSTANGTVPYSNSTLKTRLTILKDIYSYLEYKAILLNPLWKAPWEYLEDKEDFSMSGDEMYAAVEKSIGEKAEKFGSLDARERKNSSCGGFANILKKTDAGLVCCFT